MLISEIIRISDNYSAVRFFHLRVDPVLEGLVFSGKQTRSQKLFPLVKIIGKKTNFILSNFVILSRVESHDGVYKTVQMSVINNTYHVVFILKLFCVYIVVTYFTPSSPSNCSS